MNPNDKMLSPDKVSAIRNAFINARTPEEISTACRAAEMLMEDAGLFQVEVWTRIVSSRERKPFLLICQYRQVSGGEMVSHASVTSDWFEMVDGFINHLSNLPSLQALRHDELVKDVMKLKDKWGEDLDITETVRAQILALAEKMSSNILEDRTNDLSRL